ncbi:MAG TPA: hypothetical protein DDY68_02830 [Porphyromonadaceae bacterium]|nr:hypothetical protein [Porphyromonadaceae bacterium]
MKKDAIKKGKKRKILIGLSLLVLLPIVLVLIVLAVLRFYILPSERLTPMVLNIAHEYIDANLSVKKIDLIIKETFPNIGVSIEEGTILSKPDSAHTWEEGGRDTIANFKRIVLAVDVMRYLKKGKIVFPFLGIDSLSLYARVNEEGKQNWDIFQSDTLSEEDSTKESIAFRLKDARVRGLSLQYENEQEGQYIRLAGIDSWLKISIKDTLTRITAEAEMKEIEYQDMENHFSLHQPLTLCTKLKARENYTSFEFKESKISLSGMDFLFSGKVQSREEEEDAYYAELTTQLNSPNLATLLDSFPMLKEQMPSMEVKEGSLSLAGNIAYLIKENRLPLLDLSCKLSNGKVEIGKEFDPIEDIALECTLHIDSSKKVKSFLSVEKMEAKMEENFFSLNAQVKDLLGNQQIGGRLKTHLNLDSTNENPSPQEEALRIGGKMDADIKFSFSMQDYYQSNYGKMQLEGKASVERLLYKNPKDTIHFYIHQMSTTLDNPQLRHDKSRRGFKGLIDIDSVFLKYKNHLFVRVKSASANLFTIPSKREGDSAKVIPLFAKIEARRLLCKEGDSAIAFSKHLQGKFRIHPSKKNRKYPEIGTDLIIDTFFIGNPEVGGFISHASAGIKIFRYERDSASLAHIAQRRKARLQRGDTARRRYSKSLLRDEEDSKLFSQWDSKGDVEIEKLSIRSKSFPLRIRLSEVSMSYSSNEVHLSRARLRVGKSETSFSGDMNKLRRFILHGGTLSARFNVEADSIHLEELISAFSQLSASSSEENNASSWKGKNEKMPEGTLSMDSLSTMFYGKERENVSVNSVLLLPKNLNFELNSKIKWLGYGTGEMSNLQGEVRIKNGVVQLKNLGMSSKYGEGMFSLIYSPQNPKSAFTGVDLELHQAHIEHLFGFYPPIDTMLPMLKSVRGVVNCKLAITAEIDSCMSIEMPSMNAACEIQGTDLVLLDGETFAEISKKLFFKNKERNLIDSMEVQFLIKDNKIAIFPFILEMDRYKAAVAGMQGLDMDFKYHISLLKSPLPFKIGVDVLGNPDKYKIKLTKAKLKEKQIVSVYDIVEDTRINLKSQLDSWIENVANNKERNLQIIPKSLDSISGKLAHTLDSIPPDFSSSEDSLLNLQRKKDKSLPKE